MFCVEPKLLIEEFDSCNFRFYIIKYDVHIIFSIIGECEFPAQWSGRWFQSGVSHYITINTTNIVTKGECVQNVSDKFLIEDR